MSIIRNNDPELLQMKDTLHQLNIKHSLLTPDDINHRYPGLRYGPGWTGVFDPETGVLAADECRSAFQVRFSTGWMLLICYLFLHFVACQDSKLN